MLRCMDCFRGVHARVPHQIQDGLGDVEPHSCGLALPRRRIQVHCVYNGFVPVRDTGTSVNWSCYYALVDVPDFEVACRNA